VRLQVWVDLEIDSKATHNAQTINDLLSLYCPHTDIQWHRLHILRANSIDLALTGAQKRAEKVRER
jgi:hypothetical protein